MGGICSSGAFLTENDDIPEEYANEPSDRAKSFEAANPAQVHALVVYVDYSFEPAKSGGWCPPAFGNALDTGDNAQMMMQTLQNAGVTDITQLSNTQATKEAVCQAILAVGEKCDDNDTFLFFYSGHGAQQQDDDGDEIDGGDECMCLPDAYGNCAANTWITDDDFANHIHYITAGNKIILLDCCHSGTMLDLNKSGWQGQSCISITGCADAEESASMIALGGRGGSFSKALSQASSALRGQNQTVGMLYNYVMHYSQSTIPPGHQQHIQIQCTPGIQPNDMVWPL
jgi:uncharacterized caspase-like protein